MSRTTYDTLAAGRTPDIFGRGRGRGFPGAADSDDSLVGIHIVYEVSDIVRQRLGEEKAIQLFKQDVALKTTPQIFRFRCQSKDSIVKFK